MFLEIFKRYIAILLLGIVIKLLDDDIDDDKTNKKFRSQLYNDVVEYKLSYCLMFLSLAMLLEAKLIFSLFSSAYIIGMFHFPNQKLPLKLKGYEEIFILLIINITFIPLDIFFIALISIALIQLIDDLQDYKYDFKYGYKNYVNKYGKGEIIIVSSILLILCFMISYIHTIIILSSSLLIKHLYAKL